MSTDLNKALALRLFEEGWNGWDLDVFNQLVSEDFLLHFAGRAGEVLGIEGAKEVVTEWRTAFPSFHLAIEDLIAEGDKVVVRLNYEGMQPSRLRGSAAPERAVALAKILILRIDRGKIVEAWEDYDAFNQLGSPGSRR